MNLTAEEEARAAELLVEKKVRLDVMLHHYFPDEGPFRRELYEKHIEFFRLGATFKERLFMAGNRVGKSDSGAYETTVHATGLYPDWWVGRKFEGPVDIWACGTTSETTRDIVQAKLLGPWNKPAEPGMIPRHLILSTTPRRSGIAGSIESITVRHKDGGASMIALKSYEQGRESFEGTSRHLIWDDEEPPLDIYTEQLLRTLTTKGIVLVTFTPLKGMSDVVKGFIEPETDEAAEFKTYVQAGWKDVPHLDETEKRAIIATTPPYQIQARMDGEPVLGAGAIYPIAESDLAVDTFDIPKSWRRAYGMDVGWNRTAAVWGAEDPGSGVITLYSEHYVSQGEPASHAQAIRGRGEWIPGLIDPACLGSNQVDGRSLMDIYTKLGLQLDIAENSVEAGITDVWQLMVSGRLKVQRHLSNWFREFRKYHRDEKGSGKIVKRDDHLMDATRYLVRTGRERMRIEPLKPVPRTVRIIDQAGGRGLGWMK